MVTYGQTRNLKPRTVLDLHHNLYLVAEPTSYKFAVHQPQWFNAMKEEIAALKSHDTWTLVAPIKNQTILGCKWMFKTKLHSDGTIACYKARLAAQGY